MIVYDLLCDNAHRFEGWFASAEAFAHQHDGGQLSCPRCGSFSVRKQLCAPYVQTRGGETPQPAANADPQLLQTMRRKLVEIILENTEDVGERFPSEVRAIHRQEAPERAIRGVASAAETMALREEGIEVIALPAPPPSNDKLH